jgi:maleamate amidohydrolase
MAMDNKWEEIRQFYSQRGFAQRVGYGVRPAVLVVDLIRGFTEAESPLSADLDHVLTATLAILRAARNQGLPVLFTTVEYDASTKDAGLFPLKIPALKLLLTGSPWVEVDKRLEPQPGELVIRKKYASAFFGTELAPTLTSQGVDTLIVTGCTTSGCVRASVVDALQHGFRAIVPAEAVGDRGQLPHQANLFDIDAKYGDVVSLAEVLDYLNSPAATSTSVPDPVATELHAKEQH